jgi:hypothetical protein
MSKSMKEAGLVATVVNGQAMVDAEMVEGLIFHYERTLKRLSNAIQREGYLVIHDPVEDDFICQRQQ